MAASPVTRLKMGDFDKVTVDKSYFDALLRR